ncbi:nucleotidyl transferase AbiEii/AbiGii toxin family protein [Embleya sp. NPDC127516]|uniref:nucleotidyl transferase AbiEii/AbiGii toxin family protein n=1 Tax=Embleya sp. NPDC127516 TaxID=3363990 RepID=UPI003816E366
MSSSAAPPFPLAPDATARWCRDRARAMDHVLAAVAASRWVDELVLRGSVLLRAWYGSAARDPGDLDFVVTTSGWRPQDGRTARMFAEIARRAEESSAADPCGVRVFATSTSDEEIRDYDRMPGRRLGVRWRSERLPGGTVHLDFACGERLPSAPALVEIPSSDGTETHLLLGATPEQSLAWKLLWLIEDDPPRGKDVHDAALLAERVCLSTALTRATFMAWDPTYGGRAFTRDALGLDRVDWAEFRLAYPRFAEGDPAARLVRALAPGFVAGSPMITEGAGRHDVGIELPG